MIVAIIPAAVFIGVNIFGRVMYLRECKAKGISPRPR